MTALLMRLRNRLDRSETLRASGSAGLMVMTRVLGTVGTFFYTVLMARLLSPAEFGMAWTLWSAVFISAYLCTLNIGAAAIQEVVRARVAQQDDIAAGFIIVSRRILLLMAIPTMLAFTTVIWWSDPSILENHPLAVMLAAATIPLFSWVMTNNAQATSLDQVLRGHLPAMLLRPAVFLALLGAVWLMGVQVGLAGVIGIYLAVAMVIALVQFRLVRPYFAFMRTTVAVTGQWRRWVRAGLMLAPGKLLSDQLKHLVILVSAIPLGPASVAQIAVALSIVNLLNFAITAVETSFAPKTSRSLNRDLAAGCPARDMQRATHFIAISGALKMVLVCGGIAFLWLLMPFLISMFGPDYTAAIPAAWWFVLIPLSKVVFGNSLLTMQVFDRRGDILWTSILGLLALPLGGIWAVPALIAAGVDPLIAAAATFAFIMASLQALRWVLCLWHTGIDCSFPGALIRWRRHNRRQA